MADTPRSGFTTSACAAAAAVAATRALIRQRDVREVILDLPALKAVRFSVFRCERRADAVLCGVIKDAGDDPDVTNEIEVQAIARLQADPGVTLIAGSGIGRVTLPGLPVPVGEAAINPAPRRLILKAVAEEFHTLEPDALRGIQIILQIPEGERIAAQTMNPSLGITGGISILGTDGIVRPYSAPAYRASLYYEIKVAIASGLTYIGLTTGKRTASYLRQALALPEGPGVIEVGDDIGYVLRQAIRLNAKRIILGVMIGKLTKLSQGRMNTHVDQGEVDFDFLAGLATAQGAPADLVEKIRCARTAHQAQTLLTRAGLPPLEPELARRAARQVRGFLGTPIAVEVFVFSLHGDLLARESDIGEGEHA